MVSTPAPRARSTPHNRGDEGEATSPLRLISLVLWEQIVAHLKYQSTEHVNAIRETPGIKFWQRNYYDRNLSATNERWPPFANTSDHPANWLFDPDNTDNIARLAIPQTTEDYIEDVRRHVTRTTRK